MEIIGLILTALFGIPALIVFIKRKKTKLFFIKEKQIDLQDDLLKNFENLSIKYNDVEINDKITFVKGHILCIGDKDINERNNKIEIYANDILWLDFKITNASRDLKVCSTPVNNKVIIEFGLLKSGESFEFEGIINNNNLKSNKEKNISLRFFHRIPNLLQIEEIDPSRIKFKTEMFVFGLIFMALGFLTFTLSNSFELYDMQAFNAKTKEMIPYSSFSNNSSLKKLRNDYFGVELFFKRSKSYKMSYYYVKDKKHNLYEIWVYFRRIKDVNFTAFIVSSVIILLGILLSSIGLRKISQRRYFKKVKTIYEG